VAKEVSEQDTAFLSSTP